MAVNPQPSFAALKHTSRSSAALDNSPIFAPLRPPKGETAKNRIKPKGQITPGSHLYRAQSTALFGRGDPPGLDGKLEHGLPQRFKQMPPLPQMLVARARQCVIAPCGTISGLPRRNDMAIGFQSAQRAIKSRTLNGGVRQRVPGQTFGNLIAV
jgi:hypothetical protein